MYQNLSLGSYDCSFVAPHLALLIIEMPWGGLMVVIILPTWWIKGGSGRGTGEGMLFSASTNEGRGIFPFASGHCLLALLDSLIWLAIIGLQQFFFGRNDHNSLAGSKSTGAFGAASVFLWRVVQIIGMEKSWTLFKYLWGPSIVGFYQHQPMGVGSLPFWISIP